MEDWQRRLVDEYNELEERYRKLRSYNNKQEVQGYLADLKEPHTPEEKVEARKEYHRTELLGAQQRTMGEYLHLLELRAELEGIDLIELNQ